MTSRERLEAVVPDQPDERFESVDVSTFEEGAVRVEPLEAFVAVEEQGAAAVLGSDDNALIAEGSDVMAYGDGGAGKTTLMVDLALHLAAGDAWLGFAVPSPRRILLIENEGPRPRFRVKLRRKLDAWAGPSLAGRVSVLANPWGSFTYAKENWREVLAETVRDLGIEVVLCGPLTSAGMEEAGTLQDVRAFLDLVDTVRGQAGQAFTNLLVHHDNKTGKVSGAWEGAGDTLLHVQGQGHGRLRLHVQKARWASEYHGTTLNLLWADGETFEVEDKEELDDEAVAERIVAAIAANPGVGWTRVQEATPGVRNESRRAIRDGLLAAGRIVNVVKDEGIEVALAEVPERRPAHLYLADDPTITHLRPDPDADGTQPASLWEDGTPERPGSLGPDSNRDPGTQDPDRPPPEPDPTPKEEP